MNKRGFLLAEETLKIIIAVIAISFLIYFLTSIYLKNKESKDLELAKASLNHLIDEINSGHTLVEIYNPSGWVISSWPYNGISVPNYCKNLNWEKCLCIMKNNWIRDNLEYCLQSDFSLENKKIKIENPPIKLKIDNKIITQIK